MWTYRPLTLAGHVQVNTSGEESKFGVEPADAPQLAQHIHTECQHLRFRGLMTIGQQDYSSRPENFTVRGRVSAGSLCCATGCRLQFPVQSFDRRHWCMSLLPSSLTAFLEALASTWTQCLKEVRTEASKLLDIPEDDIELSMGMSGDFEQAVSMITSLHTC